MSDATTNTPITLPANEQDFLRWALRQEGVVFLDSGAHGVSSLRWGPRASKHFQTLGAGELDAWLVANSPDLAASASPHGPGAIVFAGFEAARFFEPELPPAQAKGPSFPDLWVAVFDWALVRDGAGAWSLQTTKAVNPASIQLGGATVTLAGSAEGRPVVAPRWSRESYQAAFGQVMERIRQGVFYEANLTQPFVAKAEIDPVETYLRLRSSSQPSFGAFVDLGGGHYILSSSPECFLELRGDVLSTLPIKGTRPRSSNPLVDQAMIVELQASAKEHAELTMVVDMERNDLARICRTGSIQVPTHAEVMSLPHVHHLRSLVRGRLKEGTTFEAILRATFPGGSITGAPKFSVIAELASIELERRGPYTGSIFALGGAEGMISNILIRTIVVSPQEVRFNTGGGIVADSQCEAEYLECFQKARGIVAALAPELDMREIESVLDSQHE